MKRAVLISVLAATLLGCAAKQAPLVIPQRQAYPPVVFDENGCLPPGVQRQNYIVSEQLKKAYEQALVDAMHAAGWVDPPGGRVAESKPNN